MAGFVLFEPLFTKFDGATSEFVVDISSKLITELTPVVWSALTLGFVIYALAIIRGAIDTPVNDFLWRCFRVGVIVSIATSGGLYQSQIAEVITTTPDALASALVSGGSDSSSVGAVLDQTATKAFDVAATQWEKGAILSKQGMFYLAYSIMIIVSTAVCMSIGGAFVILAKVALGILAGLGPLFIFSLLWQPTARLFESWIAQILNYAFLILLTSTVFLFVMGIYGNYMADVRVDGGMSAVYTLGGALVITIIAGLILLQLPSIASSLAGGVSLSYMWELRMLKNGVGSFGKKGSDGERRGSSGLLGTTGSIARGGYSAGRAGVRGVQKIAGYARGKFK